MLRNDHSSQSHLGGDAAARVAEQDRALETGQRGQGCDLGRDQRDPGAAPRSAPDRGRRRRRRPDATPCGARRERPSVDRPRRDVRPVPAPADPRPSRPASAVAPTSRISQVRERRQVRPAARQLAVDQRDAERPLRTTSARTVTGPTGTGPRKSTATRYDARSSRVALAWSSAVRTISAEGGPPCCICSDQGPAHAAVASHAPRSPPHTPSEPSRGRKKDSATPERYPGSAAARFVQQPSGQDDQRGARPLADGRRAGDPRHLDRCVAVHCRAVAGRQPQAYTAPDRRGPGRSSRQRRSQRPPTGRRR